MNSKRLCVYCQHFNIDFVGTPDYSEYTPGESPSVWCRFLHFDFSMPAMSLEEFRETLETALLCKDFEHIKTEGVKTNE